MLVMRGVPDVAAVNDQGCWCRKPLRDLIRLSKHHKPERSLSLVWAENLGFHMQVEVREGWPRRRSQTQRLPFDEEQWRRKPLKNLIGLSKPQNVRRVMRFTENLTKGALECLPALMRLHGLPCLLIRL